MATGRKKSMIWEFLPLLRTPDLQSVRPVRVKYHVGAKA